MATYACIGTGTMGGALARALCACADNRVILYDVIHEKAQKLSAELGCEAASTAVEAAAQADYVLLGVKPQMMAEALEALKPALNGQVLVTMAAGLTMARIAEMAGGQREVIRIMPNTPAAIGAGMILYAANAQVRPEHLQEFLQAMQAAGHFASVPEKLLDAGSAVSGCGPAYVAMFAEALSDGGVACGLPRALAMELAAQTLLGTAQLLQTGLHPGALKDGVCSPAGSTIQGVRALEKGGLRGTVMEGVIASYEKNIELSKQ